MEYGWYVILVNVIMFVVTFFCGYAPTMFNCKKNYMMLVSIFGAGLLIGAAIIVIIPEGMIVVYDALVHEQEEAAHASGEEEDHHDHSEVKGFTTAIALSLIFGFVLMLLVEEIFKII
mmetsp:Transcript_42312/g.57552  ORF Transcript_42312/g.57552 Transcript_42312/m.57552 type:complete len:118 (-) Transcript_42312:707-1060(-)|eukprot:CAMPEP_0176355664 /NCGR_PEP_ID=MMETSP0126-20121128/13452_1 /TAXON_ID=141414 ORGANISM="Strombidinopsis acuminatum, Strain SPMC142" /NCGR_SAMPLE_ID=MMETSP0126 /ASSEMBLY_ACC=CAM_ASM_000229 /LENGTH=117 /DNA_ID=CAMNT_0017708403 /DNA_START=26 /DNA_END=379 /DNA_ORIENTATION=+